jgi:porphobilinogen synthase
MINRRRRLRANTAIRDLVRETILTPKDFILPIFVVEGENIKKEISSMPGSYHYSLDRLHEIIDEVVKAGIRGVILFGLPDTKDEVGTSAWIDDGIVQRAVRKVKELNKDILVITDICMCQFTSHGHCGILKGCEIENDSTLNYIGKIALSQAKAGADMVAPSDMMDGRVLAIRKKLDENHFKNVSIMSYSAKYSSAFYGPFREAAHSAPKSGDRKTYQMPFTNSLESLREIELDIKEGADMIMIKPALPYLDLICKAREIFKLPLCSFSVSGEYALIKAAAEKGWISETDVMIEFLTSIKRAGSDIIITYFAKKMAKVLLEK